MSLFDPLDEDTIEEIIEEMPDVSPLACRFVNVGLSILFAHSIATEMTSALLVASNDDPVKFARDVNGSDVIQTLRYAAASVYGLLAPEVLKKWGIRNDNDIREITTKLINTSGLEFGKQLCSKRYYTGKRIMQPIEDLNEIESFDRLLVESGFRGLL
jgi:uncharacterized repeat protein (TIGR04138 family)